MFARGSRRTRCPPSGNCCSLKFAAWWKERTNKEGWKALNDAPLEVRRGMVERMQRMLDDSVVEEGSDDSSQGEMPAQAPPGVLPEG